MSQPISVTWIGPDLVLATAAVADAQTPLLETESELLNGATPARVMEFTAGRTVARAALEALGFGSDAILQGAGGEPVWVGGVVGSISHTRSTAAALVARASAVLAIGVDVNDSRPIGKLAAADVTWARETRLLVELGICADEPAAQNFAFSAKEATYKCQYGQTSYDSLNFNQVRLLGPRKGQSGRLSVSGWRVPATVGASLSRIWVDGLVVNGVNVAIAAIPM
jgi:4'-phosphopantetheinyl transferase EntD